MSKITNEQLLNINAALVYLSQQDTDAWMKVSQNIRKVKPNIIAFQESNDEIIKRFAEKNKAGEAVKEGNEIVFGKNQEKADEAWKVLMAEFINIDWSEIKADDITKNGEKIGLSAIHLEHLLETIIVE